MTTPAVALEGVRFAWKPDQPPLLDIPALRIARSERLFLFGPSGSGKTTLLNLLAGVLTPQQGRVAMLGEDITRLSSLRRDRFRARHIGVIFQQLNLIPYLTVLENVLLAFRFAGVKRHGRKARARALLAALGLDQTLFGQRAMELSVGQQQRVAVARALIVEPEILIADEPTSALDADNRDNFMELLVEAAAHAGSTVIFVSHDRRLESHFDRSLDIRDLARGEGC